MATIMSDKKIAAMLAEAMADFAAQFETRNREGVAVRGAVLGGRTFGKWTDTADGIELEPGIIMARILALGGKVAGRTLGTHDVLAALAEGENACRLVRFGSRGYVTAVRAVELSRETETIRSKAQAAARKVGAEAANIREGLNVDAFPGIQR